MLDREHDQGEAAPVERVPSFTLGEYLAEAGKAIRTKLPKQAWVEAVILEAKPSRAGLSLELIEPFADERNDARLKCLIWPRTKSAIEAEIGLPLDVSTLKGVQARLLVKPNFHPRWHLEGEIVGVDPAMVESLVAKRVEAIRRTLRDENLYGAQQRLMAPDDVTSVAVIHPDRSAGWADVRDDLERLQARGILSLQSFPVPFEGAGSATGIAEALTRIGASAERPDLILVVRGGGAAAGLASLANLALARAVCRCPVPIVTGLGHANDRTLIDDLAWRAADTPSKAMGLVKSILRRRCMAASEDHRTIIDAVEGLLATTLVPLLASSRNALVDAVEKITRHQTARLRDAAHGIERHVIAFRGTIDLTQAELDRVASSLLVTAPRVPRTASAATGLLQVGIVTAIRSKLPVRDALSSDVRRAAGFVTAVLDRQAFDLSATRSALETFIRRRLNDEAGRLSAAASVARALDVTARARTRVRSAPRRRPQHHSLGQDGAYRRRVRASLHRRQCGLPPGDRLTATHRQPTNELNHPGQ